MWFYDQSTSGFKQQHMIQAAADVTIHTTQFTQILQILCTDRLSTDILLSDVKAV